MPKDSQTQAAYEAWCREFVAKHDDQVEVFWPTSAEVREEFRRLMAQLKWAQSAGDAGLREEVIDRVRDLPGYPHTEVESLGERARVTLVPTERVLTSVPKSFSVKEPN